MARSRVRTATQPDFDAIKDFSELTDREDTPFFGGHTDEIATVERALKRIQKRMYNHIVVNNFVVNESVVNCISDIVTFGEVSLAFSQPSGRVVLNI